MKCIYCGRSGARVVDSRPVGDGSAIRRRRECTACGQRFTTYEQIDTAPLTVVKHDGSKELFDCDKMRRAVCAACGKQELKCGVPEAVAQAAEQAIYSLRQAEVTSDQVAEAVLRELQQKHPVVYVRYASVHGRFTNIDEFAKLLSCLTEEKSERRPD